MNQQLTLKAIPAVEGYFVDSDGTVWSAMPGRWGKYKALHPIKAWIDSRGYAQVTLRPRGKKKRYAVHSLVALAFHGFMPDGFVICHLNHDSLDNRPENLVYATQKENIRQGVTSGRHIRGERQHLAKLTEIQVSEIRARLAAGDTLQAIADSYGVSLGAISHIRTGRTWRHLAAVSA
jgi:hypothetical protein